MIQSEIDLCPICHGKKKSKNDYCSKTCFQKSKRVTIKCVQCNSAFNVLKCYADNGRKFCSRKCSALHNKAEQKSITHVQVNCSWCNKTNFRYRSTIVAHANCFCGRECYLAFHSQNKIVVQCSGKDCSNFVKSNLKHHYDRYCSRDCYKRSYEPENFNKNFLKGRYKSTKAGTVHYDSSYELRRFKELDFDNTVLAWGRCKDKILWSDEEGNAHYYNPDLFINYDSNIVVVEEIKGYVNEHTNKKIEAARSFYSNKNIEFRVIYERDLEPIEKIHEYYENDIGTFSRSSYDSIWMHVAVAFAKRSTCCRLRVGAVFVDQHNERVLCLGYNGSNSGGLNGCDSLTPGSCGCIHAEINAISHASESLENSTVYVTTSPCIMCAKSLINSRVGRIVYLQKYRNSTGVKLLREAGIQVDSYQDLVDFSNESR